MKKIIALFFVALVAVSMTFAFEFRSVGIETGEGILFSAGADINDDLDVYARFGYTGYFGISFGAQYRVADLKISNTVLPIKPGAQLGFDFGNSHFGFTLMGTVSFSYDADVFRAFVRPGIGLGLSTYSYYSYYEDKRVTNKDAYFAWTIETGVAFLFK